MAETLAGKKGLVVGVANEHSIAWGCARAFREAGAEVAVTYLNDKAAPYVMPLAEQLESPVVMPLDVQNEAQMNALFQRIEEVWGALDFVLHSIAYAPREDLHGRVTDCSKTGFLMAMDVSCHSFVRIAQRAEPLLKKGDPGGSMLTVTYYGSEKVVPNYGVMGPVKAALESAVRYMAYELGDNGIRVNAISPGPMMSRAAGGIRDFDGLLQQAQRESPFHRLATIDDVGALARFLVSDDARHMTGNISFVDAGLNVML